MFPPPPKKNSSCQQETGSQDASGSIVVAPSEIHWGTREADKEPKSQCIRTQRKEVFRVVDFSIRCFVYLSFLHLSMSIIFGICLGHTLPELLDQARSARREWSKAATMATPQITSGLNPVATMGMLNHTRRRNHCIEGKMCESDLLVKWCLPFVGLKTLESQGWTWFLA